MTSEQIECLPGDSEKACNEENGPLVGKAKPEESKQVSTSINLGSAIAEENKENIPPEGLVNPRLEELPRTNMENREVLAELPVEPDSDTEDEYYSFASCDGFSCLSVSSSDGSGDELTQPKEKKLRPGRSSARSSSVVESPTDSQNPKKSRLSDKNEEKINEVPGSTKNAEAEQKGDHCLDDEEEEDEDSIVLPPLETRISVETIEKRNELLKEKYSELNEEPIKKAFVDEVEDQTKERDEAKVDDNKFGRNSENQVEEHQEDDKLSLSDSRNQNDHLDD